MTLHVDRVAVSMDIADSRGRSSQPSLTDEQLRERIREIVIEVMASELERVRRRYG